MLCYDVQFREADEEVGAAVALFAHTYALHARTARLAVQDTGHTRDRVFG